MGDDAAIVAYIMKPSRVEDFAKVRNLFEIRLWNIIFMVIIAYFLDYSILVVYMFYPLGRYWFMKVIGLYVMFTVLNFSDFL